MFCKWIVLYFDELLEQAGIGPISSLCFLLCRLDNISDSQKFCYGLVLWTIGMTWRKIPRSLLVMHLKARHVQFDQYFQTSNWIFPGLLVPRLLVKGNKNAGYEGRIGILQQIITWYKICHAEAGTVRNQKQNKKLQCFGGCSFICHFVWSTIICPPAWRVSYHVIVFCKRPNLMFFQAFCVTQ